jgi:hypothetical protein
MLKSLEQIQLIRAFKLWYRHLACAYAGWKPAPQFPNAFGWTCMNQLNLP